MTANPFLAPPAAATTPTTQLVEVAETNGRWDLLAWDGYGDPYAYEGVARASTRALLTPVFAGGEPVVVPIIDAAAATYIQGLPPWKTP